MICRDIVYILLIEAMIVIYIGVVDTTELSTFPRIRFRTDALNITCLELFHGGMSPNIMKCGPNVTSC